MAILVNTQIRNNLYATGSITAAQGFTGSLHGTASWALNAINGGTQLVTGSTMQITSSWSETSSVSINALSALSADFALLAGFAISSSHADTASVALVALGGGTTLVTGSLYPITASWSETASWALNAINGGTSLVTGSTYPITSSWAENAISASFAVTFSYTNVDIQVYRESSSFASQSISSSYSSFTPTGRVIVLCAGFTPTGTGADVAEIPAPYDVNGFTPVTWSVKRYNFRVQTTGSLSSSVTFQKSIGNGVFSSVNLSTLILPVSSYESFVTSSTEIIASGNKLRFFVNDLGNAENWTLTTEISRV